MLCQITPPPPLLPPLSPPSISPHLLHLLSICIATRWTPSYFHLTYHFDHKRGGGWWVGEGERVSCYTPQLAFSRSGPASNHARSSQRCPLTFTPRERRKRQKRVGFGAEGEGLGWLCLAED